MIPEQLSFFDMPNGITEEEIDRALGAGSGFEGGKLRIWRHRARHPDEGKTAFAHFLRDEYGVGGMYPAYVNLGGREPGIDYGTSGIRITMRGEPMVEMSWHQVADRIIRLIENGSYMHPPRR